MYKIRGSIIAKVIVWIFISASIIGCAANVVSILYMESQGVFRLSYEAAKKEMFQEVSEKYMAYAMSQYHNGASAENERFFNPEQTAFRYGIIKTDSFGETNVDLNKASVYEERNFSGRVNKEDLQVETYELNAQSEFYVEDIYSLLDESYGYYVTEGNHYTSLYAKRICYDTREGIFYYLADDKYYRVSDVMITYIDEELGFEKSYSYAFDEETYAYRKYATDVSGSAVGLEEENGYVLLEETDSLRFNMLDGTEFSYGNWDRLCFDRIRWMDLETEPLMFIDSKLIGKDKFADMSNITCYLNENYTLQVYRKSTNEYFLCVSYIDEGKLPTDFSTYTDSELLKYAISRDADCDLYAKGLAMLELCYRMKSDVFGALISFLVLAVGCFIFLVCAAGHRKNREEIVLTFVDRIPLEIFCAIGIVVVCCLIILASYIPDSFSFYLALRGVAVVLYIAVVIALWGFLSIVVRIKAGKWWRNSICYRCIHMVVKCIRVCTENMDSLWKILLILAGVTFVEFFAIFCCGAYFDWSFLLILWVLQKLLLYPLIIFVVLQFRSLLVDSEKLAKGELHHVIQTKNLIWDFKKHGENLNNIRTGMTKAVEEGMKSERMKTELITNVSHDIKTPLTSIINYVDLLSKEDLQNEKAQEYLEVLERQSSRLKKLIEDLVEASKASSGNLAVSMEEIDICVMLSQIAGEFEEKLTDASLELVITKPDTPVVVHADGRHLWRVMENLMGNICKYSQPLSRVYLNLDEQEKSICLIFRNISAYSLNVTGEELQERFVRGDKSRNTEGHGLGLSIAKSLMELMGGTMEIVVDGDLFKVVLEMKK